MNISERDQLQASFRDFAIACWDYFTRLKEQGFNDQQALAIVIAWQTAIMQGGTK